MNIDDVARRMTDLEGPRGWRGPSGPAFTTRVMAPIYGRPQPAFTARVMSRLDEPARPSVGRSFSSGARRALILVPAALALAAGVSVLRASRVVSPALPGAPALATNASAPRMPDVPELAGRVAIHRSVPARTSQPSLPEPPPIYMIAALEGPADIAMKSIEPAACTIPALDAPAPLTVPDLPGSGGGSQRESKEKS